MAEIAGFAAGPIRDPRPERNLGASRGDTMIRSLVLALAVSALSSAAGAAPPIFLEQLPNSGVANPVVITHAGDGSNRLFIVEQAGRIRIYQSGALLATPFLDISGITLAGGERGLLGLAFHPSYKTNGFFFVFHNDASGDLAVARYTVSSNPNVATPGSRLPIITIPHQFAGNHNGGQIAFGPDGYLYVGTGDGGGGGDPQDNAENLAVLLGKILRLDINAGSPWIPGTNPFVGNTAARAEIWAYGLRNPWRFSFDRRTGDLFIADVGQGSVEEVNFQPAASTGGEHYGWDVMEGSQCHEPISGCNTAGLTPPAFEYTHAGGNCSVTGGYRYRGLQFPGLAGMYVYGDFCSGRIWGATRTGTTGPWTITQLLDWTSNISTFGEDEAGELYVAQYAAAGSIYRVSSSPRGDVTGDNKTDLFWQHAGNGQLVAWHMDGLDGRNSRHLTPHEVLDPGWKIQAHADFDGNGSTDVLWRHSDGRLAVWHMAGTVRQSFTFVTPSVPDAAWRIAAVNDFDDDGKADIVWHHDTGWILVWFMNGTTYRSYSFFSPAQVTDVNWKVVATGDFNRDRRPDLLWRNSSTGHVVAWFMNGLTRTAGISLSPPIEPDPAWRIVATGDYNRDFATDIIWRHEGTGALKAWIMNGLVRTSEMPLTPSSVVDLDWRVVGPK
jgi:glucose/arabinose dehydrogenase